MYIWILLATIMVALSFFNVSPRADKENAINEVKASLIINRFRAEHLAMARTMDCEIIRRLNNAGWRNIETQNPYDKVSTIPKNIALPYTKYECNLPLGYEPNSAILDVHHMIICLNKRIEDPDQEDNLPTDCDTGRYRYMVSYAAIPDRWLSKDSADLDLYGVARPLPVLVNLMAKASSYGSVYGWADCAENGTSSKVECNLRGYSARVVRVQEAEPDSASSDANSLDSSQTLFSFTDIDKASPLWNSTNFKTLCNSAKPCLVAYEKFGTADRAGHCKRLVAQNNPNCN
ncbi:MAG: hypothetical protein MJ212_05115 [Alphaproteobacteria bacterium]|nr:hypothetical protein [Alphaproteobacteria bacterium]